MSTLDLTKPVSTDLYTAWPTEIQGNQSSLAFMLDPTFVTGYTGLASGDKRLNTTGAGVFEQYNGSTWAALSMGYLLDSGDTMTGVLLMNNNVAHSWKDSGGTARSVVTLDGGNIVYLGDVANGITSGEVQVKANTTLKFVVNNTALGTVTASGLSIVNSGGVSFFANVPAAGEGLRIASSSGYLSGFNTANSTRTGYLQFNAGTSVALYAENGANLLLGTNSTTRATIDTNGNVGINLTPTSGWNTSARAIEMPGGSIFSFSTSVAGVMTNAYYNASSAFVYKASAFATYYEQRSDTGIHRWYTAPSGTAAATITMTEVMRLTNLGELLVGTATATYTTAGRGDIEINGSSSAILALKIAGSGVGYFFHDGTVATLSAESGNLQLKAGGAIRQTVSTNGSTTFAGGVATSTNAIGSTGGAVTVDCSKSNVQTLTLTSNMTGLTLSNLQDGQTVNLQITQDGTGSRTMAGVTSANNYLWPGGTVGVLSTAAGSIDLLVVTKVGAKMLTTLAKAFA